VPFTLVGFLDDELVGSVSVTLDDVDAEFAEEGPWLSGMFVRPPARDVGFGRQLLDEAARRTATAGHTELWAHTAEAERFYVRCGWEVVRPKEPLRRDAVVRRTLA
jgi:GNAT superfamily N-acetyltransferase